MKRSQAISGRPATSGAIHDSTMPPPIDAAKTTTGRMGVPTQPVRDSLPPRHGRAARHRATGFIAPELVAICTRQGGCQASDLAHGGKQIQGCAEDGAEMVQAISDR